MVFTLSSTSFPKMFTKKNLWLCQYFLALCIQPLHSFKKYMYNLYIVHILQYLAVRPAGRLRCAQQKLWGREVAVRAGTSVLVTGTAATTNGLTGSLNNKVFFERGSGGRHFMLPCLCLSVFVFVFVTKLCIITWQTDSPSVHLDGNKALSFKFLLSRINGVFLSYSKGPFL